MDPTHTVHIAGLAAIDSTSPHGKNSALFGALRVSTHTAPLAAGSTYFVEIDASGKEQGSMRCAVLAPEPSWFADSARVLLTSWHLGDACIEITAPPIVLGSEMLPRTGQPLSWWTARAQHTEAAHAEETVHLESPCTVVGRVAAVSTILPVGPEMEAFIVDVRTGSTHSTPVLFTGRRFLVLSATLHVGDTVEVSGLARRTLSGRGGDWTVLATTDTTNARRVDGSLRNTQLQASQASQLSQSQVSQVAPMSLGRCVGYTGEITRIVDAHLGLCVLDGEHLLVLTYWPQLAAAPVRCGMRVAVENAHVLLLSHARGLLTRVWGDAARTTLVFALCARSSVRVIGFGSVDRTRPALVCRHEVLELVSRGLGLVQLIEALEAYWMLRRKFPPVAGSSSDWLLDVAARIVSPAAGPCCDGLQFSRDLYAEFLSHRNACCIETRAAGLFQTPIRIALLRDVIARFVSWRAALDTSPPANGTAALVCYPPDLDAAGVPLIGRLVVNDHGALCLKDSTGMIRVRVGAGTHGPDGLAWPVASGQELVGHLIAWRDWRIVVETVDTSAGSSMPPELAHFSQSYVLVSSPVLLHFDQTFGGGVLHNDDDRARRRCLLVIPYMHGAEFLRNPVIHTSSDAQTDQWTIETYVNGVALEIKANTCTKLRRDGLAQFVNARTNAWQRCQITVTFAERQVHLATGCAYVICARSILTHLEQNWNQGKVDMFFAFLDSTAHVHPVRIVQQGQAILPCRDIVGSDGKPVTFPTVSFSGDVSFPQSLDPVRQITGSYTVSQLVSEGMSKGGKRVSVQGVIKSIVVQNVLRVGSASRPVSANIRYLITLGDACDPSSVIMLYLRAASHAHPLGLVRGAVFRFTNLLVDVHAHSAPFLLATGDTHAEEFAIPTPDRTAERTGRRVFCGELYAAHTSPFRIVGTVSALELLSVAAVCCDCSEVIIGMRCACQDRRGIVRARVSGELKCRVTDGTGMVRVFVDRPEDLVAMLGLTDDEEEILCRAAAESHTGHATWTPDNHRSVPSDVVGRLVARVLARRDSRVCVVGYAGSAPKAGFRDQQIRVDSKMTVVARHEIFRVVALSVARGGVHEMCWELLESLNDSGTAA